MSAPDHTDPAQPASAASEAQSECRFCGCSITNGEQPCASAEAALAVTDRQPFGCPWLSRQDRAALLAQSAPAETSGRASGIPYTKREEEAFAWLVSTLETEDCCTPGVIYEEHFTPTEIKLTVRLPDRFRLADDVVSRESKVLEGYVQRAVRTMLIQSGVTDLPCPVPLIPEHPDDSEATRLIRRAAAAILDSQPAAPPQAAPAEAPGLAEVERLALALIGERTVARAEGRWAASDRIRDVLSGAGFTLTDHKDGTTTWASAATRDEGGAGAGVPEELRRLSEAATPGLWQVVDAAGEWQITGEDDVDAKDDGRTIYYPTSLIAVMADQYRDVQDADFIAAVVNYVRARIADATARTEGGRDGEQ